MHSETLAVDRTAAMRLRTLDLLSPSNRSHNVARVPRLHIRSEEDAGRQRQNASVWPFDMRLSPPTHHICTTCFLEFWSCTAADPHILHVKNNGG